jgi:hypothetical protein
VTWRCGRVLIHMNEDRCAPFPARAASAAEQAFLPRHEFTGVFR